MGSTTIGLPINPVASLLSRPLVLVALATQCDLLRRKCEGHRHGVAANGIEIFAELNHVRSFEFQFLHLGIFVPFLKDDTAVHALELSDHQVPDLGVLGALDLEADRSSFHFAGGAAGGIDVAVECVTAM